MLIEFRVRNFRSLREEQVLSLEAAHPGGGADPRARTVPGHKKPLLPVAALYGANASGKSNVLAALAFMRDAVAHSQRTWDPNGGVPNEPFAWGASRNRPSAFEATMLVGAVRVEYGFVVNKQAIVEEWLFAWPKGRKQSLIERDGMKFNFGENFRGPHATVQKVTRENSLFLSAAAQLGQLTEIHRMFSFGQEIGLAQGNSMDELDASSVLESLEGFALIAENRVASDLRRRANAFLELLRSADFGIEEFRVGEDGLEFKHAGTAWMPWKTESSGTRTLIRNAFPILDALDDGALLLIDELEANLHPTLARKIIEMFNDPATNPKNAQLIFTTHDTNLLGNTVGEPVLRRDQVWFTEKNQEGATELYPLTNYKPRKAENLERGYLQGRYGAIPFLGEFPFGGKD